MCFLGRVSCPPNGQELAQRENPASRTLMCGFRFSLWCVRMECNPDLEARRERDERYAHPVLGKRNWRIAAARLSLSASYSPPESCGRASGAASSQTSFRATSSVSRSSLVKRLAREQVDSRPGDAGRMRVLAPLEPYVIPMATLRLSPDTVFINQSVGR
jgi:hypothetical protein